MPDDIEKELIDIAADLLCGPNPSIPHMESEIEDDRRGYAFECAKEMLIECINEREFNDTTSGKIATIVLRRDHKHVFDKHIKGNE